MGSVLSNRIGSADVLGQLEARIIDIDIDLDRRWKDSSLPGKLVDAQVRTPLAELSLAKDH